MICEAFSEATPAYDANGQNLLDVWMGRRAAKGACRAYSDDPAERSAMGNELSHRRYLFPIGPQYFRGPVILCGVRGGDRADGIFLLGKDLQQSQVAKLSAIAIAVFPSFIIWSGQLLKDGLIIFLLVHDNDDGLQLQEN